MGETILELSNNVLYQNFKSGNYSYCIILLEDASKLKRDKNSEVINTPAHDETFRIIGKILNRLSSKVKAGCSDEYATILIRQCFYYLRNCAACGEIIQNKIIDCTNIIKGSKIILESLVDRNDEIYLECLRTEIQFLSNLIVLNKKAQLVVWNDFSELLKISLKREEISHIVIMIFYNIFLDNTHLIPNDIGFLTTILDLCKADIINIPILMELLVNRNIYTKFYSDLPSEYLLTFLDAVHCLLSRRMALSSEFISFLVENFKQKSDCILKTVTDYLENIKPLEVTRLLDCICSASSDKQYLEQLQNDKSLLINCAFLLKSIHAAGKNSENNFTPVQKLSEVVEGSDEIQKHPAFGFKVALIRLLANLCDKHKKNQDMMRELDCISLLLDCCNIDARNPLIIQWVIVTIRVLCEDNPKNQAIIAETTKVRVINSEIVKRMGLTLHDDGTNKIGIARLNIND